MQTLVLTEEGNIYVAGEGDCVGMNGADALTPTLLVNSESVAYKAKDIFAGGRSAGFLNINDEVRVFGSNVAGHLRRNSMPNLRTPTFLRSYDFENYTFASPNDIIDIKFARGTFPTVEEAEHCMYITSTGAVFMAGGNSRGQLGNGTTIGSNGPQGNRYAAIDPNLYGNKKIISAAVGKEISGFVVEDGSVYVYGDNYFEQLGVGSFLKKETPVELTKSSYDNKTIKQVAIEAYHSALLMTDGSVYVFGNMSVNILEILIIIFRLQQ